MALQSRVAVTLALTLLVSLAATRTADGEVPTVADFAACNDEAPAAIKAGTASPIVGDHVRANSARAGSIEGLRRYYEACLTGTGHHVTTTLERDRRKTLQSEREHFMSIYLGAAR